jgi:hypothetical protein
VDLRGYDFEQADDSIEGLVAAAVDETSGQVVGVKETIVTTDCSGHTHEEPKGEASSDLAC